MTDYHDLSTPENGAADWHIPLPDNFAKIDEKIEVRDAESARDDYPPKPGAKFLATDTGAAFIGDGDTWNRLASTGEDPVLSSTTVEADDGSQIVKEFLGAKSIDENERYHAKFDAGYDWVRLRARIIDTSRASKPLYFSFDEDPNDQMNKAEIASGENISGLVKLLVSTKDNTGEDMPAVTLSGGAVASGNGDMTLEDPPVLPDNVQIGSTKTLSGSALSGTIDAVGFRFENTT